MQKPLFITWIEHRRTRHLCERLDLPLVELISRKRGIRRYLELAARTISTLVRHRPEVLLVQSPSIVLALLALTLRPFFRYKLIVDAHNEAVEPYLHQSIYVRKITSLLLRRADITLVSNSQLSKTVRESGGTALVLPDAIPRPPAFPKIELSGQFRVVLISTFAGDEPIEAVFDAMRATGVGIHLYVTGNFNKLSQETRNSLPSNITLTGFLAEEEYWATLASCDAVMDLTTMPNCLVCGAYEAIALSKPLLLSRNDASVELFGPFAVFTENDAISIGNALRTLHENNASILESYDRSRIEFERKWKDQVTELLLGMKHSVNA